MQQSKLTSKINISKSFKTDFFKPNGFFTSDGFTIIELLVVVSVIGILAAVSLSVINIQRQQEIAQDAVRTSTMEKLASALQAYEAAEGSYPSDDDGDLNPLNSGSGDEGILSLYLTQWPNDTTYSYALPENTLCISAPMSINTGSFFKFVTPHNASTTGGDQSCGGRILMNCPSACGAGATTNDIGDCQRLDGFEC